MKRHSAYINIFVLQGYITLTTEVEGKEVNYTLMKLHSANINIFVLQGYITLTTEVEGKEVNYTLMKPHSAYIDFFKEAYKFSYMTNHIMYW